MCYDRIASLINPESVIRGTRNQHLRVEIEFDIMDNVFMLLQLILGFIFIALIVVDSDSTVLAGYGNHAATLIELAALC